MAGKPTVLATRSVHYALDALSKNTLIDFVVDLACAELGENCGDDQIVEWIEDKIFSTHNYRGQRPVRLVERMRRWQTSAAQYLADHPQPSVNE